MEKQHKVILSSNNRISGSVFNCLVPISITQLENAPKITSVHVEWTSILTNNNYLNMFLASDSLSAPQSYQSKRQGDVNILGVIPCQSNSGNVFYNFATPQANQPLYITNAEAVLKSGVMNLRVVDRNNQDMSALNQELTVSLIFV